MKPLFAPGVAVPGRPASRPWRPTPLLYGAAAVHVGAVGAMLAYPQSLGWGLAGIGASHVAMCAAGLWPRSTWLGPNLLRLPPSAEGCVALTFDDGPNPDLTPQVLDLLDQHGASATFFCIGERAAAHPELVREIVRRGHAVENHSMYHRLHFSTFGPGRMQRDIAAAQQVLAEITGEAPRFFRAPAGLRNPFLEPVLCRLGLQLAAWTRRGFDTLNGNNAARVARRLYGTLAARDILLLHDGNPGLDPAGQPHCTTVLPGLLAAIDRAGLRCVTLRAAVPPA
ncbi:polysaccharide deacetylase family protein [Cupriavidus taiwanensis]|uniref:Putative polysaccharide deacetylase n=1 Tax=Cupriavidus taiwanensis TaxID=164546 RepID=A0A7Z7NN74_9BURK|nr:polysaccharide deacetylase family protein [Cupriavidus taiwanensis]SOZ08221.1 putative polysaccharide deacetylase [Cupriavidus taiwanensis]SOZ13012.1 putative polysaccharide deacetylase [Cupriavidus taiwanensis]SOZ41510.1 putative polysaccharide deacetylase [Cupriavidus taiwanensis]SPC20921.1 putative polysaccharide deacetylase [Cupriavidus taiwanensis]SPD55063.1 Polysaccharide deacetylase [Cupriavidus taiwanensis]